MNYTHQDYSTSLTYWELGQRYINLDPDLVIYLDSIIQNGNSKIATIKFLRAKLQIGLTLAKQLYEERQAFLNKPANPFGWTR